jgi:hypothetical protein
MKKIKLFEEFVSEISKQMISETSGRTITTLNNRKYELKKDVKDAKIGDYTESLDENFPGPGETVDAKDLDYDMLDYFSRTNKVLSIDTKTKKGIKGGVSKMYNDLVFNGDSIAKKDIVRVKILE